MSSYRIILSLHQKRNRYPNTPYISTPAYKHMCLYPGHKHMCLYPVDIYQSVTVFEVKNYGHTIDFFSNYSSTFDFIANYLCTYNLVIKS